MALYGKINCLVFVCTVCQIKGEYGRLVERLLIKQIVEIVAVLLWLCKFRFLLCTPVQAKGSVLSVPVRKTAA